MKLLIFVLTLMLIFRIKEAALRVGEKMLGIFAIIILLSLLLY